MTPEGPSLTPEAVSGPPAVAAADETDAVVRWRQAIDRVKERKLLLGTCLEEGLFLGLAGTNVRIALAPEHSFHRAMLEMKENREILNQEFERSYGRGATILCVSSDQAVSPAPARGAGPAVGPEGTTEPSGGLVQRIVELFDGEILEPGPQGSAS